MRRILSAIVLIASFICPILLYAQYEASKQSYNFNRAMEEARNGRNAEAMEFLQKEIAENPDNGYAYMTMAILQADAERYGEAMTSVNKAIQKLPKKDKETTGRAYASRGHLYTVAGDTVKALDDYDHAIKINQDDPEVLENYGQLLYELDKFQESDAMFSRIVSLNPAGYIGYMGLGRNANARGDYEEAVRQYDTVIRLYKDYSSGYSFRAESYLHQGKYLEAADDLMNALSINHDTKAIIHLFEFPDDKLTLLVTKLRAMAVKNPLSSEWQYYTGQLYRNRKMYREAIGAFRKAFDIDAHSLFLEVIADCHQKLGEYPQALDAVSEAQQMAPDDIDLISSKADILGEAGDRDGAIAEWTRYIDKNPDYFFGYYRRGFHKALASQTDGALEDYEMAIMLDPSYAYSYLGKGDMLMRKGKTEDAMEAYRKVVELDTVPGPGSCAMYAYLDLGDKEKAMAFMDKVIESDTTDCGHYYDAACLYARMGELDKSLSFLRTSLEKGYRRFNHIMADYDMKELRATEGLKKLIEEYRKEPEPVIVTEQIKSVGHRRVEIPFTPEDGCMSVKCSINDLPLNFIFDTGASIVSLSQVEANFMLKNGYLKPADFVGSGKLVDANGDISEGAVVNLSEVDFGGLKLKNVRATVIRNQKAPLLLGQSVLGRLGSIEIDNSAKMLIITQNLPVE